MELSNELSTLIGFIVGTVTAVLTPYYSDKITQRSKLKKLRKKAITELRRELKRMDEGLREDCKNIFSLDNLIRNKSTDYLITIPVESKLFFTEDYLKEAYAELSDEEVETIKNIVFRVHQLNENIYSLPKNGDYYIEDMAKEHLRKISRHLNTGLSARYAITCFLENKYDTPENLDDEQQNTLFNEELKKIGESNITFEQLKEHMTTMVSH